MKENPTNDRLRFILKTYGQKHPDVVMNVVEIIAHTVGEDRWYSQLQDAASRSGDAKFGQDLEDWRMRLSPTPHPDLVSTVVGLVNELPGFKSRHRADPIFPWIATELVQAKKEKESQKDRDMTGWYNMLTRLAKQNGTALAMWYERTRPNLGDWYLNDAIEEAKKWHEEHGPLPQGEVVAELSDGWTAQKLTTQEQLSCEGEQMQHCVGSYARRVKEEGTTIYSLRDKRGRPHVTIEVARDRVQQIRGKQNEAPDEKYRPYIKEFEEWLSEQGIDTAKYPKHLQEYAELIEEFAGQYEVDDDHIEMLAHELNENTRSVEEAREWFNVGIGPSDAEMIGALREENVTPDEWHGFPSPVMYKITETGNVPRDLDKLVAVARMARRLEELAPQRVEPERPSEAQLRMFSVDEDAPAAGRREGHDPIDPRPIKRRWGEERILTPSIQFEAWDDYGDMRWLYPAEEWIAKQFTADPDDDEYVGSWFLHYFTPSEADDWWQDGVQDGHLASELRSYRITPAILQQAKEQSDAIEESIEELGRLKRVADKQSYKKTLNTDEEKKAEEERLAREYLRFAKVIAKQIVEQVDATGVYRNPRRTSRRRSPHGR